MSQITNVQSGSVALSSSAVPTDVTVTSYTAANSCIFFSHRGGTGINSRTYRIQARKTDSTTITFDRELAGTPVVTVEWFLVEFDTTVDVQDVSRTGDGTITISAVTLSQSYSLPSWEFGGSNLNNDDYGAWRFNSTTQIEVANSDTPPLDTSIQWQVQVVDYADCSVQAFNHTSPHNWTTLFDTQGITSVDVNKTWVIGTGYHKNSAQTIDNETFRLDLVDDILYRIRRGNTALRNVVWNEIYVIEFTDGVFLQELERTTGDTDDTIDVTIAEVNLGKATAHWGACAGGWLSTMKNDEPGRAHDKVTWTLDINSSNTIQAKRLTADGITDMSWNVIEWDLAKSLVADAAFYSHQGNEAPLNRTHGGFTRYKRPGA